MNSTTDVFDSSLPVAPVAIRSAAWVAVRKQGAVTAQLLGALLVVHLYRMESPAFFRLMALATAGFIVHLALPLRLRLPFFVLLSAAGVFVMVGAADALWLIGSGAALIALCHLPFSFGVRVSVLLAAGALLAVSRGGALAAPWSPAVWPILGSMFMFRLVLYMLSMSGGKKDHGLWPSLAYFFMLPNLAFPLFPVVDYQTFRRTYYDRKDEVIYEQGLLWIVRGLVHLLLYRFVYHNVLNDPGDIIRLGDLVQFMLGTFLLYLRVSGQFHLVIGLLHLFGFRLPETHKLYYLAHSFTELWRRINIYWTDFMMKVVFYPMYFKVKRFGPEAALVLSTIAVFVTTWALHSYQWFWLRGGFPLTLQDTLFWGLLGGLVVTGALKESRTVKKPRSRARGWNWRMGLRSATTFSAFCFLWSLWSTESVSEWLWMLGAAANVDARGVVLLAGAFGTILVLGSRDWDAPRGPRARWVELAMQPTVRTAGLLLLLVTAAQPAVQARVASPVRDGLRAVAMTGLNARDAALQHRGYYEQLEVRAQPNAQVLDVVGAREEWDDLASIGMLRERHDILTRDLPPSRTAVWNGNTFSTNQWGMRDREYAAEKPAGTLRIALLGPSHVMGNGVSDGATFEALVEERLNREFLRAGVRNFEILNFGVDGYSLTQQVAILEDRVFRFSPDIVIATHYHRNRAMTERYLLKLVWGGIDIPYPPLEAILESAGLTSIDRGRVPIPFPAARRAGRWMGLDPRMPSGEAEARVRWIADDVLAWAMARFAETARSRGTLPIILGLNAVIDDAPREVPNLAAIREHGLPLIDLFDVFPEADRASLRVAPWDDHPNATGHRLIADRLYEELTAYLQSPAANTLFERSAQ